MPEFETDEAHDYFVTRIFIHEDFYDNGGSDGGSDGGSITSKIMLISTPEDEATFMTAFGLNSVKREY